MTDSDYLLCALHLILDEEERLARMCPSCREAAEHCCPVCGAQVDPGGMGENPAFDWERFEALKHRGHAGRI